MSIELDNRTAAQFAAGIERAHASLVRDDDVRALPLGAASASASAHGGITSSAAGQAGHPNAIPTPPTSDAFVPQGAFSQSMRVRLAAHEAERADHQVDDDVFNDDDNAANDEEQSSEELAELARDTYCCGFIRPASVLRKRCAGVAMLM